MIKMSKIGNLFGLRNHIENNLRKGKSMPLFVRKWQHMSKMCGATTLSIMALSVSTFIITTLIIATLSVKILIITILSIKHSV